MRGADRLRLRRASLAEVDRDDRHRSDGQELGLPVLERAVPEVGVRDVATPAERRYMHAMAAVGLDALSTADVASKLGRRQSDVSVQRDGLLNKGLIYAPERGLVAFTVPHMAVYLRSLPAHEFSNN